MSDAAQPPPVPSPSPAPPERPKRRWLKILLIVLAVALMLPVLAGVCLRLYYSDGRIRGMVVAALNEQLAADSEIAELNLSLLSGSLAVKGVSVRSKGDDPQDAFLRVAEMQASTPVGGLMFNGFMPTAVRANVTKPEVLLIRRVKDGKEETNLDAALAKLLAGPKKDKPSSGMKLPKIDFALSDATLRFRDDARKLGESRIHALNVTVQGEGGDSPLQGRAEFSLATPETPKGGRATVQSSVRLNLAAGVAPAEQVKDLKLDVEMENLDLPYLARHAGVGGNLMDGRYQWTPGKPLSGKVGIEAPELSKASIKARIETDGVVSVWEKGAWKAGKLAARIEMSCVGGLDGAGTVGVALAETLAEAEKAPIVNLQAKVSRGTADGPFAGLPDADVALRGSLDRLFATDVGTLLKLKDQIGGDVQVDMTAHADGGKEFVAAAKLRTEKAYAVMKGVRQPTSAEADVDVRFAPGPTGAFHAADAKLSFRSGPLTMASVEPIRITGLSDPGALNAAGKINFRADGGRLWQEFASLLAAFNLGAPLNEELEGEIVLSGGTGSAEVKLTSVLKRQAEPALPISVAASARFTGGEKTTVAFDASLKHASAGALDIQAAGTLSIGRDGTSLDVTRQQARIELAAVRALRQRFDAYLKDLPPPEQIPLGTIEQSGSARFAQRTGPDGKAASQEISLESGLSVRGVTYHAAPSKPGKPAVDYVVRELAIKGLKVRQGGKAGTYEASFAAKSDISYSAAGADASQPAFSLKGDWKIVPDAPLVIDTNPDSTGAAGTILFDDADLYFADAAPFLYHKATGVPCRYHIAAGKSADGTIRLAKMELKGGPAEVLIEDLTYRADEKNKDQYALSLKQLALAQPLALTVSGIALDTAKDRLAFRVSSPANDLSKLNPVLSFNKELRIEGSVDPIQLEYDGRYSLLAGGSSPGGTSKESPAAAQPAQPAQEKPPTVGKAEVRTRAGKEGAAGSHKLDVRIGRTDIDPAEGNLVLRGFVVGTPEGFQCKDPVQVGSVRIAVDLKSMSSDVMVIEEISLEGMDVSYEIGAGKTNVGRIVDELTYVGDCLNVQEEGKPKAPKAEGGKPASKPVVIRRIVLSKSNVSIAQSLLKEQTAILPKRPLPSLDVKDVRTDNLLAVLPEVARQILRPTEDVGRGLLTDLKGSLKTTADAFQKEAKDMVKDVLNVGKDAKDKDEKGKDEKKPKDLIKNILDIGKDIGGKDEKDKDDKADDKSGKKKRKKSKD